MDWPIKKKGNKTVYPCSTTNLMILYHIHKSFELILQAVQYNIGVHDFEC